MPIGTPVHSTTVARASSQKLKEWAGYFAVERYGPCHELEYWSLRTRAGLIDVSPLFKYDLLGPLALKAADRILARDMTTLKDGQVAYCCWCDEDGKVIDDGTVFKFSDQHIRITSANPSYRWLSDNGMGCRVEDVSDELGAVALQGPLSRQMLQRAQVVGLDKLAFFRHYNTTLAGKEVTISRTGFTGDLGYEIWFKAADGPAIWDAIIAQGATPCGLLALDIARIEAGFVLIDVDFKSAPHALHLSQRSSPYETGLGWTVKLNKAPFVGQKALEKEKANGSNWQLVGLEIDMLHLEQMHDQMGLPCAVPPTAWRCHVPLYPATSAMFSALKSGSAVTPLTQIGYATSGTWSPLLKKYVCLATVESRFAKLGTQLSMETMVDTQRRYVNAKVVPKPFFDPERKKAMSD